ncbi:hypothetical protein AIOL_003124 [Candidatus Rhodobacter oscarellae]|uniref:Uncharacterized protein n=1 Tax=Candidatus Rhodobacter oscarellae TaxID=1675527 RepID=A0A0J9GXD7_9RHOB|nr:DUF6476 family protein [Candidatus Rhodobacter lobularis]KMW58153.1 hypothetical protein AIOL_003124 [Candidatus Rhodobacter lobularis]
MDEAPEGDLGSLRFLRALVTTLMLVMIVGFIVLIGFLVTRFPSGPDLSLPEEIALPDGARAVAFTQAESWYAVVTAQDRILIYDRATGALTQTIAIESAD